MEIFTSKILLRRFLLWKIYLPEDLVVVGVCHMEVLTWRITLLIRILLTLM